MIGFAEQSYPRAIVGENYMPLRENYDYKVIDMIEKWLNENNLILMGKVRSI